MVRASKPRLPPSSNREGCPRLQLPTECGIFSLAPRHGASADSHPALDIRSHETSYDFMQSQPIILIPPTHEQSLFSFHVEESPAEGFVDFLKQKGFVLWRPPTEQEKTGPDGRKVIE